MANHVGVIANIRTFLEEGKKTVYIYEIHLVQTQESTGDNRCLFMRNDQIPHVLTATPV